MISDFSGVSLKGKTAIVTGASKSLGAGIALLAKRGANIVVNYVTDGSAKRAQDVVDQINNQIGTKAILCRADMSKLEEIQLLVDAALKISETGKIDILIHNAAQGLEANLMDTTPPSSTTSTSTAMSAAPSSSPKQSFLILPREDALYSSPRLEPVWVWAAKLSTPPPRPPTKPWCVSGLRSWASLTTLPSTASIPDLSLPINGSRAMSSSSRRCSR